MRWIGAAALMGGTLAAPAMAQTQAQQDRIERVSRFVVTAPMCDRLGLTVDPELPSKVEAAFKAETSAWSVDPGTLERVAPTKPHGGPYGQLSERHDRLPL